MNKEYIRTRETTHAFRTTKKEADEIALLIKLSGLTKQEYLYKKATNKEIKIINTPRVNNLLRNEIKKLICELSNFQKSDVNEAVFDQIQSIIKLYIEFENSASNKI